MMARHMLIVLLALAVVVPAAFAKLRTVEEARTEALSSTKASMAHKFNRVKAKHIAKEHDEQIKALQQDADNQKAIMKRKHGGAEVQAASMSPHLSMHATRGQMAAGARGRHAAAVKAQSTVYGTQALPPDEATPFFETYVLEYAFPTIAVICSFMGCILFRTMRMYQKERWKGTSYFHGARRSAESLLPGVK
mmetsp:Transcript_9622/g.22822  ORF Transcript_9622/g.22822 Transcript_9622/m.22822 type:complete len:193 (+) Transcript_9622:122-700(+)